MELQVVEDYEMLSRAAAELVGDAIAGNPSTRLVPAMGNTPMGLYRRLAERRARQGMDTSRLTLFQLDEYLDVTADDSRSLYGWAKSALLDPLGIPDRNMVRLPGDTRDPEASCRAYAAAVRERGGIDLAVLGLGPNGHLGFNEPPSPPDAPTRPVDLTESSIESSSRYWGGRERVPRRALTAGMAELLAARHVVLLVAGAAKREILRRALWEPATPLVPASYLQGAPRVTVIADAAAMGSS